MDYNVEWTKQCKKDAKKAKKRGLDLSELFAVVEMLAKGETLPESYKDHKLIGNYAGKRELHISPDWLLIYDKKDIIKLITLVRTGTHSDLF
ncbi:MAG: type II toxin-antitoxin system YafQ family toxin [Bacteroidales bacterium]|nr:type II toxin-antitoxin system YafQ family toxin [Bacteroidales bacterium]